MPVFLNTEEVAPFMGAWIEIIRCMNYGQEQQVAPFMGAWIEMNGGNDYGKNLSVAPFMGAWIEIIWLCLTPKNHDSRSLHGSVD